MRQQTLYPLRPASRYTTRRLGQRRAQRRQRLSRSAASKRGSPWRAGGRGHVCATPLIPVLVKVSLIRWLQDAPRENMLCFPASGHPDLRRFGPLLSGLYRSCARVGVRTVGGRKSPLTTPNAAMTLPPCRSSAHYPDHLPNRDRIRATTDALPDHRRFAGRTRLHPLRRSLTRPAVPPDDDCFQRSEKFTWRRNANLG